MEEEKKKKIDEERENLAKEKEQWRRFYRQMYPRPKTVVISSYDPKLYQELRDREPSRFDLCQVGKIFESWRQHPRLPEFVRGKRYSKRFYVYKHDGLQYRSTVFTEDSIFNWGEEVTLHLKLSNDGLLYKGVEEMDLIERDVERHRSSDWAVIDCERYEQDLGPILNFANSFFGSEYWLCFFYNDMDERIDFRAYDKAGAGLVITFEPGYPENDYNELWARKRNAMH